MPQSAPARSSNHQPATSKEPLTTRLLRQAHSPGTASAIHADKLKHKPLILYSAPAASSPRNPQATNTSTRDSGSLSTKDKDGRQLRRDARNKRLELQRKRRSKKPKPLSARDKRRLCVYETTREERNYSLYLGLHQIWCSYIRQILGLEAVDSAPTDEYAGKDAQHPRTATDRPAPNTRPVRAKPQDVGPLLVSADFHGADIEVVRCRCVSRVGVQGIVIRDTKFTFEIITKSNDVKVIPKEFSIFRFTVPLRHIRGPGPSPGQPRNGYGIDSQTQNLVFELYGEQFKNRAPDRANKKFKPHVMPDL